MTVEIKELTINVNVAKDAEVSSNRKESDQGGGISSDDQARIVSACVDQVMRVIATAEDR